MKLADLLAKRAALVDETKTLNEKLNAFVRPKGETEAEKAAAKIANAANEADKARFAELLKAMVDIGDQIARYKAIQEFERETIEPAAGQDKANKAYASVETDPYVTKAAAEARGLVTNKGLVIGGVCRMLGAGRNSLTDAIKTSTTLYGENHPITKALVVAVGGSGGFIIPPDYINEIIELLRPMAVVRAANPRTMPMPRGTMTLPSQTGAATASYGGEIAKIPSSQQTIGQIIASYKKLTALVPISNDLLRYADPAADAFVRDDLVKVQALREDLAFLTGDGTQSSPRGFLSFANEYAVQQGGSAGTFLSTGNSTYASGGNFITSTEAYTLATVASELGGAINRLDTANVPDSRRVWFMHPRSYNYLYNVQNALGVYTYRDEMAKGTLLGYPLKRTTQMPSNLYNTGGSQTTCSFVMLVEMTDAMILDSMSLELFVSREGSFTDSNGNQVNLVEKDMSLVRSIAEHDFQMRHPASIAVIQGVLWAPAIS